MTPVRKAGGANPVLFPIHASVLLFGTSTLLRFWKKPSRDERYEAYTELFATLASLYQLAAGLKQEWIQQWEYRREVELPPKYRPENFEHPGGRNAAYDLKFATKLLQQNRWKSKVQPLFETVDKSAWIQLRNALHEISPTLLGIKDVYVEYLGPAEIEWINNAVEQFDQVRHDLRISERDEAPSSRVVADTTYGTVYTAMQLSDRLVEHLRQEAEGNT